MEIIKKVSMAVNKTVMPIMIQLTLLSFLLIFSIFFLLAIDVKLHSILWKRFKIDIRKEGQTYRKRVIRTKKRGDFVSKSYPFFSKYSVALILNSWRKHFLK